MFTDSDQKTHEKTLNVDSGWKTQTQTETFNQTAGQDNIRPNPQFRIKNEIGIVTPILKAFKKNPPFCLHEQNNTNDRRQNSSAAHNRHKPSSANSSETTLQTPDKLYFSKAIMEIITEGNHTESLLSIASFSLGRRNVR